MKALDRDRSTLTVVNHSIDVRRARGEAVQAAEILGVIDQAVEVLLSHFEEGGCCQQTVASGLVLLADTADLKVIGNILQAAFQGLAAPHEELNVVDAWEPNSKQCEEVGFLCRQRTACYYLEQVTKVVSTVERDPLDVVEKRKS